MLSRNLKKFKLITFDCTNTLLYFKRPPSEIYLNTAVDMGHKREDFDLKVITSSFRKNFKMMQTNFPNFGKNSMRYRSWWTKLVVDVLTDASKKKVDPRDFKSIADVLIDKYETQECWSKFSCADDLIQALKNDGKTVGVISNFDQRLHELLKNMGLYYNFDFVITSYEADAEKPDRKIFQCALDKALGINMNMIYPNESLHIGNEIDKDYQGALEAGWSAILLNAEKQIDHKHSFQDIEKFWQIINCEKLDL